MKIEKHAKTGWKSSILCQKRLVCDSILSTRLQHIASCQTRRSRPSWKPTDSFYCGIIAASTRTQIHRNRFRKRERLETAQKRLKEMVSDVLCTATPSSGCARWPCHTHIRTWCRGARAPFTLDAQNLPKSKSTKIKIWPVQLRHTKFSTHWDVCDTLVPIIIRVFGNCFFIWVAFTLTRARRSPLRKLNT
jgi:hypothetical protein